MSEPSKALPNEWIGKLFQRFRSMYGNKVDTTYGAADQDDLLVTWAASLGEYEGADLKVALEVCRFAYKEFPPTLFQFADLCRDAMRRRTGAQQRIAPPRGAAPVDAAVLAEIHRLTDGMSQRDPKDWARRILKRHESGTHVMPIALSSAREALGL